jgi:hypothetical protein
MIGLRGLGPAAALVCFGATTSFADDTCTCRAQNRNIEIGQTVCLSTAKGFRLATCGMVLNNTSWAISETPCVSSRFDLQDARQLLRVAYLDRED